MKKFIFLTATFFIYQLFIYQSKGQNLANDLIKITDPNVASFNKFIEHPVDTYNGSTNISIPVYTIKDGIINYPINLRYNSSGIRVDEEASWVGLGWNLDVGGYIQQNVIGEMDADYFRNGDEILHPGNVYRCQSYVPTLQDLNTNGQTFLNASLNRLKPDIYTFSFLNNSGKFYIDNRDYTIHPLSEDENLKIEYYGSPRKWKVTDEDGNQYFFDFIGSTYGNDGVTSSITNYLSEIIFSNGQRMIFTYKNYNIVAKTQPTWYLTYFGKFGEAYFDVPDNNIHSQYNTGGAFSQYNAYTLDKIITDNYQITFNTSSRIDVDGGFELDNIEVQSKKNLSLSRKFIFDYDYFVSPLEGNYWHDPSTFNQQTATHRLKLLSFYEEGIPNKYVFSYQNNLLPVKTSFAVDYWGYYNGQTDNNTLLPKLLYMNNVDKNNLSESVINSGANRAFNQDFANACMLNKITYPTGGFTEINYEPHTFSPFILPTVQEIADYVDMTSVTPVQIRDDNYENTTTTCFDILYAGNVKIERQMGKGLNTWQEMLGSKVYIVKVDGSTITNIDTWELTTIPDGDPTVISNTFLQQLQPGHYCVTADLPDVLGNNFDINSKHGYVSANVYVPQQTQTAFPKYSKGGGLRIKSIVHKETETNNPVVTFYDYEDKTSGLSYGKLLSEPQPYQKYSGVHYILVGCDPCPDCAPNCPVCNCVENAVVNEFEIRSDVAQPLSFSSVGGNVAYSSVVEHSENVDAVSTNNSTYPLGYKIYNYNNNSTTSCSGAPVIPDVMNGTLNSIEYFDAKSSLVRQDIFSYYTPEVLHNYYGVHAIDYWMRHGNLYWPKTAYRLYPDCCNILIDPSVFAGRYGMVYYELNSYRIRKESEEIRWSTGLKETISYKYNSFGQLSQKSTINSNGNNKVENYSYISDNPGTSTDHLNMQSQHIYSPMVEKNVLENGKTTYHELNTYINLGEAETPKSSDIVKFYGIGQKQIAQNGNAINKTVEYGYNVSGVPTFSINHVQENGNMPFAIYYAFNNILPVVKAENLDFSVLLAKVQESLPSGYASLEDLATSITTLPNTDWNTFNTNLRSKVPGNCLITTYTYNPLYGMSSQIDPNGITTFYEYDSLGRLINIRDNDNNIIKHYDYHYKQ